MATPPDRSAALPLSELKALVDAHYQPLYRFAYSLAGNEADAKDLVQDVFVTLQNKGGQVRDKAAIKGWLFTSLRRDFFRKHRRASRWELTEPADLEAESTETAATASTFDDQLDGATITELLQQLEPTFREPLVLFYLRSLSYQEISATLAIPVGTVMSRLNRGKIKLRQLLEDYQAG